MRIAIDKLIERGYRRIGFVIHRVHNERLLGAFLGAYLAYQYGSPLLAPLEPLVLDEVEPEPIRHWIKKEKPEVIIGGLVYDLLKEGKLLDSDIPEDTAIVGTDVPKHGELSGIFQNHEHDGAEGIRMLVGQLLRNEFGIPKNPMTYTTFGSWHEGTTAPKRKVAAQ
jgi:DNA-binding LacI/PurR family transcriptional regulator